MEKCGRMKVIGADIGDGLTTDVVIAEALLERIEMICNHGNERDMRFRNQLIKDLGLDPTEIYDRPSQKNKKTEEDKKC